MLKLGVTVAVLLGVAVKVTVAVFVGVADEVGVAVAQVSPNPAKSCTLPMAAFTKSMAL